MRRSRQRAVATAIPGPQRPGWRQGLLFAHLALSPVVFSRATLESFEYPKLALLLGVAIVLATAALPSLVGIGWNGIVRRARERMTALWRSPIALGIALLLLSAVVSTVTSVSPRTSFWGAHQSHGGLLTVLAYLVLFFGTREACPQIADFRRLLWAPVLGAGVAAGYALVQLAGVDPLVWRRTPWFAGVERVSSTLGHPNLLAGYLAVAVPLLAGCVRDAVRRGRRGLAGVVALCSTAAVAVAAATLSRAAWVALAVGLAVLAAGWLLSATGSVARSRAVLAAVGALTIAIVAMAGLLAFKPDLRQAVGERIRSSREAGLGPRVNLWGAATAMFCEHPVLGVGPDCFHLAYQEHRSLEFWRREGFSVPMRAHSEPLHVLATQGLLGGAAMVIVVWGAVRAAVRAFRSSAPERDIVVPVVAALVAFAVYERLNFTVVAIGTLAVTLLALMSRLADSGATVTVAPSPLAGGNHRPSRGWRPDAAAVAAGAVWILIVDPYRANVLAARGANAIARRPESARELLGRAVAIDGGQALYWLRLAEATETVARRTPVGDRPRLYEEARAALVQARELVPVDATPHALLGSLLADMSLLHPPLSGRAEVERMFAAALEMDPLNPLWLAEAARSALQFKDLPRARLLALRGRDLDLDYGAFTWTLASAELADALRTRAIPPDPRRVEAAVQLLAQSVDQWWFGDDRRQAVASAQLSVALLTMDRVAEARAAAERALHLAPDLDGVRLTLARIHERLGEVTAARAEYRQVLRASPQHPIARAALDALEKHKTSSSPGPLQVRIPDGVGSRGTLPWGRP
jgi:O-antigen ligase